MDYTTNCSTDDNIEPFDFVPLTDPPFNVDDFAMDEWLAESPPDPQPACRIAFTVFMSPGTRMSKRYREGANGDVDTDSGTQFSTGVYRVAAVDIANPVEALTCVGLVIDRLKFDEAIGLGVPVDGTITGKITTKDRITAGETGAIARSLDYFGWPRAYGLLLCDGDGIDGLREILCELYPPLADTALLVRPSASASVINPKTGKALKRGEHCYIVLDDPSQSKACLDAFMRLAWVCGNGKAKGWLMLSKCGSVLVRGPVDTSVGSPERLSYEGAIDIGPGLDRLPREAHVVGGAGVLCAANLVAFADQHAPEAIYNERLDAARNDPEFVERRKQVQIAYRGEYIEAAVKRGRVRQEVEAEFDEAVRVGSHRVGAREYLPLPPDQMLYWPGGGSFTVADIQKKPKAFHKREVADPVEGLSYQSKNCAIIYTDGPQIVIHSRAHGDAYSYVAPFAAELPWDEVFALLAGGGAGITIDDFYAFLPQHIYLFALTGEPWVAASINSRLPSIPMRKKDGSPVRDDEGKPKYHSPSSWLDKNRGVEQMTWAPGLPEVVKDQLITEGGWFARGGCSVFNLYKAPLPIPVSAEEPAIWLDHLRKIYPEDADHIIPWMAHRVQKPQQKLNHALFLGGNQGIGKDTLLEPLKRAVGPWNFKETTPTQILGRFNGHLKAVVLRISEARDLGEFDRFKFYDHTKNFIAAPPDVLRVDEKNLREHPVPNVCGVVITSNHKTDGIFLPPDDRRHYVAWSTFDKTMFTDEYWKRIWDWYDDGGIDIVAHYLATYDLTDFNPKAPPPLTAAFWEIVHASRTPEDAELADALDEVKWPDAVTIDQVSEASKSYEFSRFLKERSNARRIPHRFEACGYTQIRNPDAKDGLWKLDGRRQAIYGRAELAAPQRMAATREMEEASRERERKRAETAAKAKKEAENAAKKAKKPKKPPLK